MAFYQNFLSCQNFFSTFCMRVLTIVLEIKCWKREIIDRIHSMQKYKGLRLPDTFSGEEEIEDKSLHHGKLAPWRKKRITSYRIEEIIEEMTGNILHDPNLSQSYWNPSYYPPVPRYTPPVPQDSRSTKKNEFLIHNLHVVPTTVGTQEFDEWLCTLADIDPSILGWTWFRGGDVDIITGYYQGKDCLYPQITTQVGYRVSLLLDPRNDTEELTGIYVLKTPRTLNDLLWCLANLEVSNKEDLIEAKIALHNLYFSITSR